MCSNFMAYGFVCFKGILCISWYIKTNMASKAFTLLHLILLFIGEVFCTDPCDSIQAGECLGYQQLFDPQPSVLKSAKKALSLISGKDSFQKIDPKALFAKGLTCLQYDSFASPAQAYNRSDPVVVYIEDHIMTLDEMTDVKKEIALTRKSTTYWVDERLKWPENCGLNDQLLDIDLGKVWFPEFQYDGMKEQEEKTDATAKTYWIPVSDFFFLI